jgi:hypothetical protein
LAKKEADLLLLFQEWPDNHGAGRLYDAGDEVASAEKQNETENLMASVKTG